ncbi:hypothetical protein [Streptomyces sp. HUAS ZL42]|uniref:hypothetical protein n=1 Tax=Streptomyces sp. HUAS ZL42 TaxID=3231715 RepID=UPI00345ECFA8
MQGAVRRLARGSAALAAVASLAAAGWLIWLLPGPALSAVLGFGPVDGVVVIAECHDAIDAEGNSSGTDCTGSYVPRGTDEPSRAIVLQSAAEDYRAGTGVEVRTARGRAYELSSGAVQDFGTVTGLLLVPFLTLSAWLFTCARHARLVNGEGFFFAGLGGIVAVLVLAFVAGLLVGIGTAVF